MTYMFEVYCKRPSDAEGQDDITTFVREHGGTLDFVEQNRDQAGNVILTYEFDNLQDAEKAAAMLRGQEGCYVEGPGAYGE